MKLVLYTHSFFVGCHWSAKFLLLIFIFLVVFLKGQFLAQYISHLQGTPDQTIYYLAQYSDDM